MKRFRIPDRQQQGAAGIEVPIGATLRQILRIAYQHPRQAVENSGIAVVIDAESERAKGTR